MNAFGDSSCLKVDLKWPTKFSLFSVLFLYVLQYPLSLLMFEAPEAVYSFDEWIVAYIFIIYSSTILIIFMRLGIAGPAVVILPPPRLFAPKSKKMPMMAVLIIFFIFFIWSYLMRNLKVGMTIYTDFDELPFRITGLLFYGRLIVQPLILAYIARGYAGSESKIVLFMLLVGLGAWAALTSGSRFIGVVFALPFFLLFNGKSRYAVTGIVAGTLITVATLSRHFYLPFYISDEYIEIYANEEYQENIMRDVFSMFLGYFVSRGMGIGEMLLTLGYGDITSTFEDATLALISFFTGLPLSFSAASVKNIYGLNDDAFGGFGLGLFPNYWVFFGGNFFTYTLGLAFVAFMLGKCHRFFSIATARFGLPGLASVIFIILFIFLFEARGFIFPMLLVFGWVLSRPYLPKLFYTSAENRIASWRRTSVARLP